MKQKLTFPKQMIILMAAFFILLNSSFVFAASEPPELISQAAILLDNKTDKILYEKRQTKKCIQLAPQKL